MFNFFTSFFETNNHNYKAHTALVTRSSANADGQRDALSQLKSCQLLPSCTEKSHLNRLASTSFTVPLRGRPVLRTRQTSNQIKSLDFQSTTFMKLFETYNIQTIMECQSYFGFQLPSVRLCEKSKRFDDKYSLLSVLTCCSACNYAFMFCELLCFFVSFYLLLVNNDLYILNIFQANGVALLFYCFILCIT